VPPPGGVQIREDGKGEDEAGGDNYLRVLSPAFAVGHNIRG
jgi:hypothetical protein